MSHHSYTGSAIGGVLVLLEGHGPQSRYEDVGDDIDTTFFKVGLKKHTPFGLAVNTLCFNNSTNWGNKICANIHSDGDLMWQTWCRSCIDPLVWEFNVRPPAEVVGLPLDIQNQPVFEGFFSRLAAITSCHYEEMRIGGTRIDQNDWVSNVILKDVYEGYGTDYGKLIHDGKSTRDLIEYSKVPMTWYRKIQMFFDRPQQAYPCVATRGHETRYEMTLKPLCDMIQVIRFNTPHITTLYPTTGSVLPTDVANPFAFPPASESFGWNGSAKVPVRISGGELRDVSLNVTYVLLSAIERNFFLTKTHYMPITQTQIHSEESISATTQFRKIQLSFNHIISQLYLNAIPTDHLRNRRFLSWDNGNPGESPIQSVAIFLNNQEVQINTIFDFLNRVQPAEKLQRSARYLYAAVCFGVDAIRNIQPTGGVNASMIDKIEAMIYFKHGPATTTNGLTQFIRARSRNLLIISRAVTGLKFAV